MSWREREGCRLCAETLLDIVLKLEPTPPANEFVRPEDPPQELIPLFLVRCPSCGHVQLPIVVDPERLFRNYVYVSGTAPSFVEHFRRYAEECTEAFDLRHGDLVVEIGSNDGTLLRAFKALGMSVQGVDPALQIAELATSSGIPTLPTFFTRIVAANIKEATGKTAALVVANNVFAHADDLRDIALGVRDLLDPKRGRFVFEVQYLLDLVDGCLFDMIYHEHLSYHHLTPLAHFFHSLGMSLVDVQRVATHGGSVRCTAVPGQHVQASDRLRALIEKEALALDPRGQPFIDLELRISIAKEDLRLFLDAEAREGRQVAGYGAPAKMTTLCHELGVTAEDIAYVVDDSPWKQGLLAPGTRIPIVAPFSRQHAPDAFVIFAWNFAEPIAKKLRASGFRGKIVTPLPKLKEL